MRSGKVTRIFPILVLLAGVLGVPGSADAAKKQKIIIGTGGVKGVYYSAGIAVCRLLNKKRKRHGIVCQVKATGGSVFNVKNIRANKLEFGVVQSDVQYDAFHGRNKFASDGPFEELRSVFSVHPEPVTVLTRSDTGIKHIDDVKGKRHNIGNIGSGTRATWEILETALGWTRGDLKLATELKSGEMTRALCDDKIDSYFWLVGHPSGSTEEAVALCDAVFVEVGGSAVDKLVKDNSFYRYATIPGGMYKGNSHDTKTFGVGATFVTRANVADNVVYEFVMSVFKNFDTFNRLHAAFGNLKREEMVKESLSAPLHPGALKAFKELGLL